MLGYPIQDYSLETTYKFWETLIIKAILVNVLEFREHIPN